MSHAEFVSRPIPAFAKLAVMLRSIPVVQFVYAKFAALLRNDKTSGESQVSKFLGEAPGIVENAEQNSAGLKASGHHTIAAADSNEQPEREKLIRRRWAETGIKMWNPNFHGGGHAALKIQGCAGLLPKKPGETVPGYDNLEFKVIAGRIVCEGVVVNPPRQKI
jgi:hypothetical protein